MRVALPKPPDGCLRKEIKKNLLIFVGQVVEKKQKWLCISGIKVVRVLVNNEHQNIHLFRYFLDPLAKLKLGENFYSVGEYGSQAHVAFNYFLLN